MSVTVAGVALGDPQVWTAGNTIRVSGLVQTTTTNMMGVYRYLVEGILDNPDEASGVPVIVSTDSFLTGFYRVVGGGIKVGPEAYTGYWFEYDLELERVLPVNAPQIESRILGALRTNSHSIAVGSTVPWWATPSDASMDYVAGATRATRTCDAGSVLVNYTTDGTLLYDTTQVWQAAPGDFYDMAARFEVTYDGSTWVRLPGLQVGIADPASATGWRLINDYMRVTYGGGNGLLSVEHNFGSGWTTAKIYKLTRGTPYASTTVLGPFKAITLLKNHPAEVVVRISVEQDSTNYPAQVNLDLRLRRGALWVEGTVTRNPDQTSAAELASTSYPLGIARNTTEAGTSHTSGVHATSSDGTGKYILTSPTATTVDTAQGAIMQGTGVNTFEFMIGKEPASASGPDTFTNQVYAYMANTHEKQRLARR